MTGKKALYVNRGFTHHIVGVPRDESDAILAYLYQHAENPLFQCRFRWTENAIAFWDNRCSAASGHVGLLAAHAVGQSGDGEGRTSRLTR